MSVFNLHAAVLDDYRDFVRSFFSIADDRARDYVEHALSLITAVSSIRAYRRQRWNLHGSIIADNGFADMDRSECSRENKRRTLRFYRQKNRVMIGPESGHERKGRMKTIRYLPAHNPRSIRALLAHNPRRRLSGVDGPLRKGREGRPDQEAQIIAGLGRKWGHDRVRIGSRSRTLMIDTVQKVLSAIHPRSIRALPAHCPIRIAATVIIADNDGNNIRHRGFA